MSTQLMLFDADGPDDAVPSVPLFIGIAAHGDSNECKRRAAQLAFLTRLLEYGGKVFVDDVIRDLDQPFADGGNWLGSAIRELGANGLIEHAGSECSRRASRRKGLRRGWILRDKLKATDWVKRLASKLGANERNDSAAATAESV